MTTEQPEPIDAEQFALAQSVYRDVHAVINRHLESAPDDSAVAIHLGVIMAVGSWISASAAAYNCPEERVAARWISDFLEYLAARTEDRAEAAAATKH